MDESRARQQRRSNLRLGLVLGSIALVFFVGIIVKKLVVG